MAKKKLTADMELVDWERFIRSVNRNRDFIPDLLDNEAWRSYVYGNQGPFASSPPVTIAQADFFATASEKLRDVLKEATGVEVTVITRANGSTRTTGRDAGGRFTSLQGAIDRMLGR